MSIEPLKNKVWDNYPKGKHFRYEDIKSAVEWAIKCACKPNLKISHSDFKEIMKDAFYDVFQKQY